MLKLRTELDNPNHRFVTGATGCSLDLVSLESTVRTGCIMDDLSDGTLICVGRTHRRQRKMLLPVFSAKHLRGLVPVFYCVTHKVEIIVIPPSRSSYKSLTTVLAAH